MKKVFIGVASVIVMASLYIHYGITEEREYKMCLGAQGISNTFAKVFGDEPTNACNE